MESGLKELLNKIGNVEYDEEDIEEVFEDEEDEKIEKESLDYEIPKYSIPRFDRKKFNKEEEMSFYKNKFQKRIVKELFDNDGIIAINYCKKSGIPFKTVLLLAEMEAAQTIESDTTMTGCGKNKLIVKLKEETFKPKVEVEKVEPKVEYSDSEVKKTSTLSIYTSIIKKKYNGKKHGSITAEAIEIYEASDKSIKLKSLIERLRRQKKMEKEKSKRGE